MHVLLRLKVLDRLAEFHVILGKHVVASPKRLQFPVDLLPLALLDPLKEFVLLGYYFRRTRGSF
jgi:hypothetical protein